MAEFAIEFNPEQMIGKLNDLQKLVIPKAAEMALNETAFAIREQMKKTTKEVFDRPVPLTVNSTFTKKHLATSSNCKPQFLFVMMCQRATHLSVI